MFGVVPSIRTISIQVGMEKKAEERKEEIKGHKVERERTPDRVTSQVPWAPGPCNPALGFHQPSKLEIMWSLATARLRVH